MAPDAREINWVAIEVDYRAGIKPLRLLADEHGITHGAINKRAKRDNWTRDLAPRIKAAADAKVSRAVVSKEVSSEVLVTEELAVEMESAIQARIRLTHRSDIGAARETAKAFMAELKTDMEGLPLAARTKILKDLSETLRILIDKERQAFGIDDVTDAAAAQKLFVGVAVRFIEPAQA